MNVTEPLRLLQAEHDETAARADCLRDQIDQLTSALAEVEARLAEIVTTGRVRPSTASPCPDPHTSPRRARHRLTVHRDCLSTSIPGGSSEFVTYTNCSGHPPTSPPSTSPAPAWDDSSVRDSSDNPDTAGTRSGLTPHFVGWNRHSRRPPLSPDQPEHP